MVNFNYRLGEGVINQRVTINTMGAHTPKHSSLIGFSRRYIVVYLLKTIF